MKRSDYFGDLIDVVITLMCIGAVVVVLGALTIGAAIVAAVCYLIYLLVENHETIINYLSSIFGSSGLW